MNDYTDNRYPLDELTQHGGVTCAIGSPYDRAALGLIDVNELKARLNIAREEVRLVKELLRVHPDNIHPQAFD